MYHVSETKKQNNQTQRDEEARLVTTFEKQDNGDVWLKHDGRTRIWSGQDAIDFLHSIKGWKDTAIAAKIRGIFSPVTA